MPESMPLSQMPVWCGQTLFCTMASTCKFQTIRLTEDDVLGAKLIYPEVENQSVVLSRRWLLYRGVITSGNQSDLVQK